MLAVQVILCAVLVLGGAALLALGFRGLRGRLPRNTYVGVRTPAAMRSEQAFELANRAAGPAMLGAGAIAALSGIAQPMLPTGFTVAMVAVIGLLGAFALMTVGGVVGNRAAETVPAPSRVNPSPCGPCTGCAGGCSA